MNLMKDIIYNILLMKRKIFKCILIIFLKENIIIYAIEILIYEDMCKILKHKN